MKKRE
jgi:uncharacterized glyoxalase superfamily metalloenzyme YdcJ